jgi:hypothetical protein
MTELNQVAAQITTTPTFESKFIDLVLSSPAMKAEIEKRIGESKPKRTLADEIHEVMRGNTSEAMSLIHKWLGVEVIVNQLLDDGGDADLIISVVLRHDDRRIDTDAILNAIDSNDIFTFVVESMSSELADYVNENGSIRSFDIEF